MSFKKFKQILSKEEKKKLYTIKKLKKQNATKKKYKKYRKKVAKQHFEYPSTVPTSSRVAFKDQEQFIEKNGLRIPIKIPLTELGDQLREKNIHEYIYYKKQKTRGGRKYTSTSVITNDVNNVESSPLKRLNVPVTTIIDYNTLQKKTDSITFFEISDVPNILFSVAELMKRFNIQHPIKIQYISISGFFTVQGVKTPQLFGGELLFMIDKASKVGERQQQITLMPPEEKILHKQMLQYNKDSNFLTVNNSKNYNNVFFKKKLYINKDTIITVSFLPIPLIARQALPILFNGNIMIAFNYTKKK